MTGKKKRRTHAKDPKVWDWFDTALFCTRCGRRGSRDFVVASWWTGGHYGDPPLQCKWEVACSKRWAAARAEKEKEEAAEAAAEMAAVEADFGTLDLPNGSEPVDLDKHFPN